MSSSAARNRFPATAQLATQFVSVFWNEFLFRYNSCHRKGLDPAAAGYFVVAAGAGTGRSWKLTLRYYLAALANLILLVLGTQKKPSGQQPIFLFTNLRHGRFFNDNSEPVRVGLYNLRYLQYPHLLAGLSFADWLSGIGIAFKTYPAFLVAARRRCEKAGIPWPVFRRLALCGRLRHLDAVLHSVALEKHGGEVWCPGHFDMYVFVASLLREHGALRRLVGCQHGLFENPPAGHRYERLYADAYRLLFEESRNWVVKNYLKAPDCEVTLDARAAHIDFQTFDRPDGTRVVAFAAQEISHLDEQLIDRLLAIKERSRLPLEVLLYAHPLFPCDNTGWAEKGLRSFSRERHANIDALVTRFSTLGLDYHRLGVPAIFVPFDDRVCIFDDPSFTVCGDLDAMESALNALLNLSETGSASS